ncbi:MAG: hypothetical protein K8I60_00535 [Anaerolineae bacterium]|nr:hypothetical protein [Anaerolineae bacterium]
MDDNKPLLVIFPYVALDDPLEIRGEILFPSTFLTLEQENIDEEGHWYDNERKEALNQLKLYLKTHLGFDQAFFDEAGAMLVKIKGLFYWYTNEQVDNVIWCFLPASSSPKRRHQFKTHLEEIMGFRFRPQTI